MSDEWLVEGKNPAESEFWLATHHSPLATTETTNTRGQGGRIGVYDQASRFADHDAPEVVVRRVLTATTLPMRLHGWESPRTLTEPGRQPGTEDRTADNVAIFQQMNSPAWWLLLLEYQAQPDPDKLDLTLLMAARLRVHARQPHDAEGKYRVLTALVYLVGRCPEPSLDMTTPGNLGTRHAPLIWNVMDDDAEATLALVRADPTQWGWLYWVPLMRGADTPDVVAQWLELTTTLIAAPARQGNLKVIALVFAELAKRFLVWERGLRELDMTESAIVNLWMSQAENRGAVRTSQQKLLKLLRERHNTPLPADVITLVNTQDDLTLLDLWFTAAIRCNTLDHFLQSLK